MAPDSAHWDPTHAYPVIPLFADVRDGLCGLHGMLCHDEAAARAACHQVEADQFHAAATALSRILWAETG